MFVLTVGPFSLCIHLSCINIMALGTCKLLRHNHLWNMNLPDFKSLAFSPICTGTERHPVSITVGWIWLQWLCLAHKITFGSILIPALNGFSILENI